MSMTITKRTSIVLGNFSGAVKRQPLEVSPVVIQAVLLMGFANRQGQGTHAQVTKLLMELYECTQVEADDLRVYIIMHCL